MTNFDELLVETLRVHPDVLGVYRYDGAGELARYTVDVAEGMDCDAVSQTIAARVSPDLDINVTSLTHDLTANLSPGDELWSRPATAVAQTVRKAAPRSRREPPREPTLDELVASLKEVLLAERNELIAEGGLSPDALAGYVLDVSDPCCPPKFKEMMGGDKFVNHCRASGRIPLAAGVMPRSLLVKHVEPIARKVEKMPESPIFFADAPVPRTIRLLEGWRQPNEMVVVTAYKKALGLKAILVPSLITLPGTVQ